MAFSFDQLDLSGVEASKGVGALPPGKYLCVTKDAKIRDTRSGGKQLEIAFEDKGGAGSIRDWINVHVPASQEATRIGREQLKALLLHGGHPNPDKPGDIRYMNGLTVGVAVKAEEYEKDGEKKKGSKVHYFFHPSELGAAAPKSGGAPASNQPGLPGMGDLEDTIPF
jgi:hypothetical protein